MTRFGPGHLIDLAAIAAMTALAILDRVPVAVTASLITMIVAARFRPPLDSPPAPPRSKGASSPPPASTSSPSSSGSVVSIVSGGFAYFKRALGLGLGGRHP